MMAEIVRIAASPGGPSLFDLADGQQLSYSPDSIGVTEGSASGSTSIIDERYGGSVLDFEQRGNGTLHVQIVAHDPGGYAHILAANVAAEVERADPPGTRFIEWQPAGATSSLWYERRGAGTCTETQRWPDGTISVLDVAFPVGPAAFGAPVVVSPAAQALPAVFALGTVPGSLWAALDVSLAVPAVTTALAWGLVAPFRGGTFGIIEAETMGPAGWSPVADGGSRGGNMLGVSPAVADTQYTASWIFDPSTVALNADEFERDVTVEVWVRLKYDPANLVAAILRTWATPPGGLGAPRWSVDFGPGGRQLATAHSGTVYAIHRAGLLKIPAGPANWGIFVSVTPAAGTTSNLGMDYAMTVPGRWRASSPTGIALDASYPVLAPSNAALTKRIAHDLSGQVAASGSALHADTGLGGSPLYVSPGASSVLIAASPSVPDDPASSAGGDVLGPSVAPTFTIWPRFRLIDSP